MPRLCVVLTLLLIMVLSGRNSFIDRVSIFLPGVGGLSVRYAIREKGLTYSR